MLKLISFHNFNIVIPLKLPHLFIIVTLFAGLAGASCDPKNYNSGYYKTLVSPEFPYNLGTPFEVFEFPKELREISGLEYYKNNIIAGIQDESGVLYLYNIQTKKLARKIKFSKHGDYEGVAIAGNYAFVINSKGDLFGLQITNEDHVDGTRYKTPFSSKNNIEGLCYNPADSSLLIVCKEKAGIDSKMKGRAVYRYGLSEGRIDKEPFIHITNKIYLEKLKSFDLDIKNHSPFKPSGISINPTNGNIYLISSVGRLMIVFDHEKKIIDMIPLARSIFRQPEGICFSPEGDLFISSEGGDRKGYMIKFRLEK